MIFLSKDRKKNLHVSAFQIKFESVSGDYSYGQIGIRDISVGVNEDCACAPTQACTKPGEIVASNQ